jgi:mannobiose 2-epimerase
MLQHQLRVMVRPFPYPPLDHEALQKQAIAALPALQTCLLENITDFWLTKALDQQNGGYLIRFDHQGNLAPDTGKGLVTQARLLWFFSRLYRSPWGQPEHRQAAQHGYQFLVQCLGDQVHGGYVWLVDHTGQQVLNSEKYLYGQSFALYALSEYFLATQEAAALDQAQALFLLIHGKAYDAAFGGYFECLNQRWERPQPTFKTAMGVTADQKTMNTHLHLLEGISTFFRASGCAIAQQRILELMRILTVAVTQGKGAACFDQFQRDWSLVPTLFAQRISYGHGIENIWLLMDACEALDISPYPLLPLLENLFTDAMQYGYDWRQGGFYDAGYWHQAARWRDKVWWVQAEAMVGALSLYQRTRSPRYLWVFNHLWTFVNHTFIDWQQGEWHHRITSAEVIKGMKADLWKTAYHNGRAVLMCLDMLTQVFPAAARYP